MAHLIPRGKVAPITANARMSLISTPNIKWSLFSPSEYVTIPLRDDAIFRSIYTRARVNALDNRRESKSDNAFGSIKLILQ